jgi:hypothetical protein
MNLKEGRLASREHFVRKLYAGAGSSRVGLGEIEEPRKPESR